MPLEVRTDENARWLVVGKVFVFENSCFPKLKGEHPMGFIPSRIVLASGVLVVLLASGFMPTIVQAAPAMTSPSPGATLSGSSELFSWSANGTTVYEWWLHVGSSQGTFWTPF